MEEREVVLKFMQRLEGYYEKYKPEMFEDIQRWVSQLNYDELRGTYQKTIESYSSQYGRPPDVSILAKALKDFRDSNQTTVDEYLALPDPDFEERKRTISDRDKMMGASFVRALFEGLNSGQHPLEVYEDWAVEHTDWVEESLGPVQDVVRRVQEEYEEKGGRPYHRRSEGLSGEGGDGEGPDGGRDDILPSHDRPDPEGDLI